MKMKQFLTGILLVAAVSFASCKSKPKDMLEKKWKFVDLLVPGMSDTERVAIIKDGRFEFKSDGTYTSFTAGKEIDGKFSLSDDGKTLTLNASSGSKYEVKVSELTDSKFVGSIANTTIVCEAQ